MELELEVTWTRRCGWLNGFGFGLGLGYDLEDDDEAEFEPRGKREAG